MKVAVVREGGLDFSFPRIELGTGREPGGVLTSLSAGGLGPGEPKAGRLLHLAGEEQGETMSTRVWEGGLPLVFSGGCSLLVRHCQAEAGVRALAPGQGLWGSEGEGPPTLGSAPDACLMRPKLVRDPEHCGGGASHLQKRANGQQSGSLSLSGGPAGPAAQATHSDARTDHLRGMGTRTCSWEQPLLCQPRPPPAPWPGSLAGPRRGRRARATWCGDPIPQVCPLSAPGGRWMGMRG